METFRLRSVLQRVLQHLHAAAELPRPHCRPLSPTRDVPNHQRSRTHSAPSPGTQVAAAVAKAAFDCGVSELVNAPEDWHE